MSILDDFNKSVTGTTLPAGCWDLDLATGALALCRQSRTMFGFNADSTSRLTESEWAGRFHPDDLEPVREALTTSLVRRTPYAERFRTIHPDGRIQVVLGIGRPLECPGKHPRFVGWNFDAVSTGEMAAGWISAHPEAVSGENLFSVLSSSLDQQEAPLNKPSSEALLERAQSIFRVRGARERLLGRGAIGEPAFDLLLCLYVRSPQKETSLTSLARSARIPYSSAMRWIRYLADKGLVERTESRSDHRVICVQFTPHGREAMNEFLSVQ